MSRDEYVICFQIIDWVIANVHYELNRGLIISEQRN